MIDSPLPEDVPEIERIAVDCGAFTPAEVSVVREMVDTFLHPEPRDDHTFIVCRSESRSVLGFACFGPTPMTDRIWDLYWICVDRPQQKSGIGRRLLQYAEEAACAQGARALYIETSDSEIYQPARNFYTGNGYECAAHIDEFYAPGEGKVIYRKVFKTV